MIHRISSILGVGLREGRDIIQASGISIKVYLTKAAGGAPSSLENGWLVITRMSTAMVAFTESTTMQCGRNLVRSLKLEGRQCVTSPKIWTLRRSGVIIQ